MKREKIIALWDILHLKDTGELGFSDLEDAINRIDIGESNKTKEISLESGEIKIGSAIYFVIPDKANPGMYYLSPDKERAINKVKEEVKRVEDNLKREEHGEIKE